MCYNIVFERLKGNLKSTLRYLYSTLRRRSEVNTTGSTRRNRGLWHRLLQTRFVDQMINDSFGPYLSWWDRIVAGWSSATRQGQPAPRLRQLMAKRAGQTTGRAFSALYRALICLGLYAFAFLTPLLIWGSTFRGWLIVILAIPIVWILRHEGIFLVKLRFVAIWMIAWMMIVWTISWPTVAVANYKTRHDYIDNQWIAKFEQKYPGVHGKKFPAGPLRIDNNLVYVRDNMSGEDPKPIRKKLGEGYNAKTGLTTYVVFGWYDADDLIYRLSHTGAQARQNLRHPTSLLYPAEAGTMLVIAGILLGISYLHREE